MGGTMRLRPLVCVFLTSLAVAGCRSIGPAAIRQGHPGFNGAIAQTLDEQLLLNIVRMRYLEPIFFLDVGNVTDSRRLGFHVGTSDSMFYVNNKGKTAEWNPTADLDISQSPTIVYSPMQGQSFVKRLMVPVPLPVLLDAIQSGWSVQRVFGIFVERMNHLTNAPSASGPTPTSAPDREEFSRLLTVMANLLHGDGLTLGLDPADRNRLVMRLHANGRLAPIAKEFRDLLALPSTDNVFSFQENLLDDHRDSLKLRTRSVQSALFYLANGVQVPREHLENGIVPITRLGDGSAYDWSVALEGQFTVCCSDQRPADAFLAIPYRGHWFFIADRDLASKSTFMLLMNIFNLQAGDPKVVAPTLTIPIAR
ncbi:MAG: hypothetical protein LBP65_03440 [Puniceicoccales bacterium]|jgi:hypothetical protein|nr:hypothetical protein [Puniceicoccales bacterium]